MISKTMKLPVILLCLVHLFCTAQFKAEAAELAYTPIIARPGCKDKCGNMSIPFPWGIGANCFLDSWFEIECKPSPHPKPFLSKFNIELLEIGLTDFQAVKVRAPALNVCGFCVRGEGYTYTCQPKDRLTFFTSTTAVIVYIALSLALAPLLLVFGCRWLYYITKRRRKAEKRVKFFKLMLQRHQSSNTGAVESTKLFTHRELDKATEHFNENRILGKGGQGTVYKGMLTDGRIVAVKKSKLMDETQMEQFINEVVILSQTNHRNVVKLFGCCLETEVPLLAYEFISSGTLHQHIHGPGEDVRLSWATRLKIAADSAGAIAYLHSYSSTPIYHRDIKSSNILLDEKYRAKVSDFGSSKTVELDQTHLTTLVQGTFGYLDPEYFESGMFTEKSDVYSFGVVLLELLTSMKPIYRIDTMEQKSLVMEFLLHIRNSSLSSILDPEVVKEAKEEEITAFVHLAKRCLNGSGRSRPTMKEVAMTLEMIIQSSAETNTRDEQAYRDEGFDEIVMHEPSDAELTSSTIHGGAASSLYIDVEPLLRDTI